MLIFMPLAQPHTFHGRLWIHAEMIMVFIHDGGGVRYTDVDNNIWPVLTEGDVKLLRFICITCINRFVGARARVNLLIVIGLSDLDLSNQIYILFTQTNIWISSEGKHHNWEVWENFSLLFRSSRDVGAGKTVQLTNIPVGLIVSSFLITHAHHTGQW